MKKILLITISLVLSFALLACNGDGNTEFIVTFNSNGSSDTYPAQTVLADGYAVEPDPAPTMADKDFSGWWTLASGGSKWIFSTNKVTEDITLYAQFVPKGTVQGLPQSLSIEIDGVLDEEAYSVIPARTSIGVRGAVTVNYAASKEGLYFGITVVDKSFGFSKTDLLLSDYVGISVDPKAVPDSNDGISETTHLFRFDIQSRYTYSKGNDYGAWEEVKTGKHEGSLDGSETPEFALALDENEKYVGELFFTWEMLGVTVNEVEQSNNIMYYIEHRDYGIDIHSDCNIVSTGSYNRLRLLGDRKGSNMPEKAPEITIDGQMNEDFWKNATITNQGNFSELFEGETAGDFISKAFFGNDGVYLGIWVDEEDIQAPNGTGSAYKNCGFELRLHTFSKDGLPKVAYKWLFDIYGPQWHETVSGGLTSSFVPFAEYKYFIDGTINDDSDTDKGWGIEIYIPYSHLKITDPTSDYLNILNAIGSFEQNNALPASYRNNPANLDGDGNVSWDNPLNYIKVSK